MMFRLERLTHSCMLKQTVGILHIWRFSSASCYHLLHTLNKLEISLTPEAGKRIMFIVLELNCIKFEPICKDIAVTLCIRLIKSVRRSNKSQNDRNVQMECVEKMAQIQTQVPASVCSNCFAMAMTQQLLIFLGLSMYSSITAVSNTFPFRCVYSPWWSVC